MHLPVKNILLNFVVVNVNYIIYIIGVDVSKSNSKWIAKAIKKPGALHKQLGVASDKKIPAKKLNKAAEKGGKLGKRANLAKTLGKMRHGQY
jgi:hypothetical protein